MLAYLIKSILCLLVLWGFYKIALEQTAAHHFKRVYLLGSLVLALTLPLISFSYTVEVEPQTVVAETYFEPVAFTEAPVSAPVDEPTNWLLIGLGIVYVAGVLLFGFRFLRNLIRLRHKITCNEKVEAKTHINVLLAGKVIPHSFLKFIFLPKTEFKTNSIAPEILAHEQAHVTQKHSLDMLAVEFLEVIFWFNPLLVFLKRSIALNHEFLADRAALAQNTNTENYIDLLFTYSGGAHHTALSSPINYSLTKKRILMLSKTRSVKKLATRLALFVPVLALCVYFFNQEILAKPISSKPLNLSQNEYQTKVELIEILEDRILINGELIKLEDIHNYFTNKYSSISEDRLEKELFISIQIYPNADRGFVSKVGTEIYKFGKGKVVRSASEFGHNLERFKAGVGIGMSVTSGDTRKENIPHFAESPAGFVKYMNEKEATFFYESKEISAEKAEALLKRKQGENNTNYFVHTTLGDNYQPPMVQINDY